MFLRLAARRPSEVCFAGLPVEASAIRLRRSFSAPPPAPWRVRPRWGVVRVLRCPRCRLRLDLLFSALCPDDRDQSVGDRFFGEILPPIAETVTAPSAIRLLFALGARAIFLDHRMTTVHLFSSLIPRSVRDRRSSAVRPVRSAALPASTLPVRAFVPCRSSVNTNPQDS